MESCLDEATLSAMRGGATVESARRHVTTCVACRERLSATVDRTASRSFEVGAVLSGKYHVERILGEGGMGRVYAARQLGLSRPVAIKVLRPELTGDATSLARFQREAKLIASLASENVVRVHDLGMLETGEPYLVMELLDGEDLETIARRGPIATELASRWIADACRALSEAHALGVVHRDIKPSNLFLTRGGTIKVLDFGIAKLSQSPSATALTADGHLLGSPLYMAPEQILGAKDVDARADVWSLGATLYQLLTGRPPFEGLSAGNVFASILEGRTPPLDALRPDLAAVIARSMVRDPSQRYATVDQLASALQGPDASLDGRFELLELLGQGLHGTVYRARERSQKREVALKIWTASTEHLGGRFAREAAIVQRLTHPNTVRLFEAGVFKDGARYMVFELVRGRTLEAELARGPLPAARVARIASQILMALMEAHALGVVHRDVKPSNVLLVDHAGTPDFVKLLDFGVALDRAAAERGETPLTSVGQIVGTPRYMAPEQVDGAPVDLRCDLYALGLVMAEALTGAPVFQGESAMAICMMQASSTPPPLPRAVLSGAFGNVIARATAKTPAARFGSANEMLDAIETARSAPPAVPEAPRRSNDTRVIALVAGFFALFFMGSLALGIVTAWKAAPSATAANDPPTASPGRFSHVDEKRLRGRLEKLGWTVTNTTRETLPLGRYTFLNASGDAGWASVTFVDCYLHSSAASEAARLRSHSEHSWVVDDGRRVLMVSTQDEKSSRALFDALLDP